MSSAAVLVTEQPDPAVRRRNLLLGGILVFWVVAVIAIFVWRFTVAGLPKDKNMVEEMERRGQAVESQP